MTGATVASRRAPALIFVYGTLKRGGENHAVLAGQQFIGEARTASGYRLYQLDGYPGLVPDPAATEGVRGEVWSVDGAALRRLDALEGVDEALYRRAIVRLQPPFDQRRVETYLYVRSVEGRPILHDSWPV